MAVDLDGTQNSWQDNLQSVITNYPFTLMAWVQISTSGLGKFIGTIGDINATNKYMWWGQNADDTLRYTSKFTTAYHAYTTNTMSVDTWHHACVIGTSATDRRVILDGDWANSGTNTTSSVMSAVDSFQIASNETSSNPSTSNTWQGVVQDYTVWNVALTQAEVEALAAGRSPLLVRPQSIKGYWPLTQDDNPPKDVMGGGIDLTRNTTWTATTVPSRTILQPTAQIIPFPPAAAPPSGSYTIYNNYYRQLLAGNV